MPAGAESGTYVNTTGGVTGTLGAFAVTGDPATDSLAVSSFAELLVVGTAVRRGHVTELRTRIDALRTANGLSAYPWTDPVLVAGTTPIKAKHLTDMRTALDQVAPIFGRSPQPWQTNPAAVIGLAVLVQDFLQLRTVLLTLEAL